MNDATQTPTDARVMAPAQLCEKIKGINKVVVAIHGIGSQTRSSTIRYVVRQFGDRRSHKLPLMPLGFFHIGPGVHSVVSRLPVDPQDPLLGMGFVEVFWADIPRGIVEKKDTLEETKAWARTIVSQAQAIYACKKQEGPKLGAEDFGLAAGVVEEVVETMAVLENLCAIAEKAGVFKFDLAALLRDYVDDVQVVTEFEQYRREILFCFHRTMAHIEKVFNDCGQPLPEIYIVAHSEGTVVSFLGLLEALAGITITNPDPAQGQPETVSTGWVKRVRGYMTIGSPIDKHLVLWPRLWDHVKTKLKSDGPPQIQWRNYYDFGDPVGFELDTARAFLKDQQCNAFEFDGNKHDFGFSRYALPGKAHNDYWQDAEVFGHFIDDVVSPPAKPAAPAKPPRNKVSARAISWVLPYLLVYLVHVGAIYALFKGVSGLFEKPLALEHVALQLLALGGFFIVVTMCARLPRLTKSLGSRWPALLAAAFLAALSLTYLGETAEFVGDAAASVMNGADKDVDKGVDNTQLGRVTIGLIGLAIILTGWLAPRRPRWGRRTLLFTGGLLVVAVVVINWMGSTVENKKLWPSVLGSTAFIYMWWLGILLFDLVFVWNRYIRQAAAIKALSKWTNVYSSGEGWKAKT